MRRRGDARLHSSVVGQWYEPLHADLLAIASKQTHARRSITRRYWLTLVSDPSHAQRADDALLRFSIGRMRQFSAMALEMIVGPAIIAAGIRLYGWI
jgi:hypothetical protein